MIADVVIGASILFAAGLGLVWALVPGWRAALERPKHRFQADVLRYDEERPRARGLVQAPHE